MPENLGDITLNQYQDFIKIKDCSNTDVLRVFLRLSSFMIGKISLKDVNRIGEDVIKPFEVNIKPTKKLTMDWVY